MPVPGARTPRSEPHGSDSVQIRSTQESGTRISRRIAAARSTPLRRMTSSPDWTSRLATRQAYPLLLKPIAGSADVPDMSAPTARRVALPAILAALLLTGDAFVAGLDARHGALDGWLVVAAVALLGVLLA